MKKNEVIEILTNFEACAYKYSTNNKVLGMDCVDFEDLMIDIIDILKTTKWINVKDKLPEANKAVLTYDKKHQIFLGCLIIENDNKKWIVDYFEEPFDYVSYWMPLPIAPD